MPAFLQEDRGRVRKGVAMQPNEDLIRVVLVDDDPAVREGYAQFIGSATGFLCAGVFATAEDYLKELGSSTAEVVLMDIQLPGMSGIECIQEIKVRWPDTQILMLTVFEDPDRIFRSLAAGATGYLLKQTPPEQVLQAIRDIHHGGAPMSASIARRVVDAFREPPQASPPTPAVTLTPREQEILGLLARGYLYKEIADRLKLSVETVRTHLRNIYGKLQVRTRTEAVMKVYGRTTGPGRSRSDAIR